MVSVSQDQYILIILIVHQFRSATYTYYIPEVGDIPTIEEFNSLTKMSSHVIVVNKGKETAGFIILMREKEEYHSLNYKFFTAKYDEFLYVDRVAIKDGFS